MILVALLTVCREAWRKEGDEMKRLVVKLAEE